MIKLFFRIPASPPLKYKINRVISSEVERFLDTEEASGSIPLSPTKK